MTEIEYIINNWVLPPQLTFRFDAQDDEEDLLKAEVREKQIKNVRDLVAPIDPVQGGEPLINPDDARRLLRRWNIVPENLTAQDEMQFEAWNRAKMLGEPVVVLDRYGRTRAYEVPQHIGGGWAGETVLKTAVHPVGQPMEDLDIGELEPVNVDDLLASAFPEVS